jgi:hypothetical protein
MDLAVFVVNKNKHENHELEIQLYALGLTQIGCYCELGLNFANVWRIQ